MSADFAARGVEFLRGIPVPFDAGRVLLGRNEPFAERVDAAESFAGRSEGDDALFEILVDETEDVTFRFQSRVDVGRATAGAIGSQACERRSSPAGIRRPAVDRVQEGVHFREAFGVRTSSPRVALYKTSSTQESAAIILGKPAVVVASRTACRISSGPAPA